MPGQTGALHLRCGLCAGLWLHGFMGRPTLRPVQAVLKWGLQKTGGVVIPRSANSSHMAENIDVFGLPDLSPAELVSLSGLPQKKIFNTYCQPWC